MSICRLETIEITIEKKEVNAQLIETYTLAKAIQKAIFAYDAAIPERYPQSLTQRVIELLTIGQQSAKTNNKQGQ